MINSVLLKSNLIQAVGFQEEKKKKKKKRKKKEKKKEKAADHYLS